MHSKTQRSKRKNDSTAESFSWLVPVTLAYWRYLEIFWLDKDLFSFVNPIFLKLISLHILFYISLSSQIVLLHSKVDHGFRMPAFKTWLCYIPDALPKTNCITQIVNNFFKKLEYVILYKDLSITDFGICSSPGTNLLCMSMYQNLLIVCLLKISWLLGYKAVLFLMFLR